MRNLRFALIPAVLFLLPGVGQAGWFKQVSNTDLPLNDVCFVDSLYGWAVGGNAVYPGYYFLVALRTTDGGASWLKTWDTTGVGNLKAVTFINRFHGWALVDSGISLESTDGGVSWHNLPSPNSAMYPIAERFVNDTLGYMLVAFRGGGVIENANIAWTTDGGMTWSLRNPRAREPSWLQGLDVQGPRWAWAVGEVDSMVLTRDAGTTWPINYLTNSSTGRFNGVAFGDTTIGVAIGSSLGSPTISRTSDGGFTWTQQPIPVRQNYWSAEMSDTLHSWACGGAGTIIASTDGGMDWAAQVSGTQVTLNKIWFVNDHQGWAVGDSGVILHTVDGGWAGVLEEPSRLTPYTSRFTVTPNPFVSYASVHGHEAERFALYDITGRKVGTYRGDRIGEGLAAGVYFLRTTDGSSKPLRIVKLR